MSTQNTDIKDIDSKAYYKVLIGQFDKCSDDEIYALLGSSVREEIVASSSSPFSLESLASGAAGAVIGSVFNFPLGTLVGGVAGFVLGRCKRAFYKYKKTDDKAERGRRWFQSNKRKIQRVVCGNEIARYAMSSKAEFILLLAELIMKKLGLDAEGAILVAVLIVRTGLAAFCENVNVVE